MYRIAAAHEIDIHISRDISVLPVGHTEVADQSPDTHFILSRHGKRHIGGETAGQRSVHDSQLIEVYPGEYTLDRTVYLSAPHCSVNMEAAFCQRHISAFTQLIQHNFAYVTVYCIVMLHVRTQGQVSIS